MVNRSINSPKDLGPRERVIYRVEMSKHSSWETEYGGWASPDRGRRGGECEDAARRWLILREEGDDDEAKEIEEWFKTKGFTIEAIYNGAVWYPMLSTVTKRRKSCRKKPSLPNQTA